MQKLNLFLIAFLTIFICGKISAYSVEMDPSVPLTGYTSLGEWNTAGDFEGWDHNDDFSSVSVSGGSLKGTATGSDPVTAADTPSFYVQAGSVFELRIKLNASPSTTAIETFVRIDGGGNVTPGLRFLNGAAPTDNAFHVYRLTLDSGDTAYFGNLTSIRLDPMSASGDNCEIDYFRACDPTGGMERIQVNGHVLETESGKSFFPVADTAWLIASKLDRAEVITYLDKRKSQHFNTINMTAFINEGTEANQYGDHPFQIVSGKYDPLQPITTTGSNPANAAEYDFWDHLDFIINSAKDRGLYVILLPAWGARIAGAWGSGVPNSDVILNTGNAKSYATWIATRYKNFDNIIWMISGDRSGVYGSYDYRPAFREMAAGVLAGNPNRPLLQSFHPQKGKPNSSEWFHNDSWLSFNSIQDYPTVEEGSIRHDFALSPTKPTWLFEGRYEDYSGFGSWQVRFQAYQTVFAGGFGYTYGHMSIWDFDSDWETQMDDPGANDMQHLRNLMYSLSDSHFFSLVPDQTLIDGDTGSMPDDTTSSRIVAIRSGGKGVAMVYSANGRNITVKMSQLYNAPMRARWFNPRDGSYSTISTNVPSGSGAPNHLFDPPGSTANGNDYILVLDEGGEDPGPGPDPNNHTIAYWRFEEGTAGHAHSGHDDGFYQDYSSNTYNLSAWGSEVNPTASSDVKSAIVPRTGENNNLSLLFNGSSTVISGNSSSGLNTHDFSSGITVELIAKFNAGGTVAAIAKTGRPSSAGDPTCTIKRRSNNILQFTIFDGAGTKHNLLSAADVVPVGSWCYIAGVCNDSTVNLYILRDGDAGYQLIASDSGVSGGALYSGNEKWSVGAGRWSNNYPDGYVDGLIDEVRISDIALPVELFLGTIPEPTMIFGGIVLALLAFRRK